MQETYAHAFLERTYELAKGRGRYAQLFRCPREIEGFRDRNKCPQLTEIRARKERIQGARRLIHESSLQGL